MASVRIPADVDREDVLLAGMTARQLGLVSAGALVLAGLWAATRALVPAPLFLALASPLAAVLAVVALGRRDGVSADRLLVAWLRHSLGSRRLVPAPEGVPALPRGVAGPPPPAPLRLPVQGVGEGVLDLGGDGLAAVCRVSSLNFALRTDAEQEAIVVSFARWLNALSGPVQVVVRAERIDVAELAGSLVEAAPLLPHAALAEAAEEHSRFLAELASRRDVLRRVALLVLREPAGPGAADLLRRRVDEAVSALSGAGVAVAPMSDEDAVAALAAAAEPNAKPPPVRLSLPGRVVTRTP